MRNLSSFLNQSLEIYAATESPSENVDAQILSIHCPKVLLTAYKAVCNKWGLSHADVTRHLITKFVVDSAKDLAFEEMMSEEGVMRLGAKLYESKPDCPDTESLSDDNIF